MYFSDGCYSLSTHLYLTCTCSKKLLMVQHLVKMPPDPSQENFVLLFSQNECTTLEPYSYQLIATPHTQTLQLETKRQSEETSRRTNGLPLQTRNWFVEQKPALLISTSS